MSKSTASTKYVCTFKNCDESFTSLRLFESHLTQYHLNAQVTQVTTNSPTKNAVDSVNVEPETTSNETESGLASPAYPATAAMKQTSVEIVPKCSDKEEDEEEEDIDVIQGLLKLGSSSSSNTESVESVDSVVNKQNDIISANSSIAQTPNSDAQSSKTSNIKNHVSVIPMMNHRMPYVNLIDARAQLYHNMRMRKNQMFAVNARGTTSINGNANPKIQSNDNSIADGSTNVVKSKKRSLEEMNSDDLAHLYIKVQDKMNALNEKLNQTKQQHDAIRQLYRKRMKTQSGYISC